MWTMLLLLLLLLLNRRHDEGPSRHPEAKVGGLYWCSLSNQSALRRFSGSVDRGWGRQQRCADPGFRGLPAMLGHSDPVGFTGFYVFVSSRTPSRSFHSCLDATIVFDVDDLYRSFECIVEGLSLASLGALAYIYIIQEGDIIYIWHIFNQKNNNDSSKTTTKVKQNKN